MNGSTDPTKTRHACRLQVILTSSDDWWAAANDRARQWHGGCQSQQTCKITSITTPTQHTTTQSHTQEV